MNNKHKKRQQLEEFLAQSDEFDRYAKFPEFPTQEEEGIFIASRLLSLGQAWATSMAIQEAAKDDQSI